MKLKLAPAQVRERNVQLAPGLQMFLTNKHVISEQVAMKIKKILFPTDFSEFNDAALEFASRLAAESGAILYIVHADDMEEAATVMFDTGYPYPSPWDDKGRRESHQTLQKVVPTLPGIKYQHCYLGGTATGEIVKFAEQQAVDLIVMASHGRTGLRRLLIGSTAENLMRQAPCPVLIVKQPARSPATGKVGSIPEVDVSNQI
jgi:nucleotide-binding universal stress UspA family protein